MTSKLSPWLLTALATALVIVSGCQSKSDVERQREAAVADAEREVPKPATASLKRTGPFTRADRATWRALLQWPEACDTPFTASASGNTAQGAASAADGAGLSLHPAGAGITMVDVRCSAERDESPAHVVVRFDERGSSPVATVLKFPTVTSADSHAASAAMAQLPAEAVVGDLFIAADGHTLSLLTPARTSRDCGTWTRYNITGEHPRLVAATQLVCPTTPGSPVTWRDGESPAGWRPLDIAQH